MALLACSMILVSCKKDTPKPEEQTTDTKGVTISFNGSTWKAADMYCINHADEHYMEVIIEKTANCGLTAVVNNGQEPPTDICMYGVMATNTGTYNYVTNGAIIYYADPSEIFTDEEGVLGEVGKTYWRWNEVQNKFAETITAIDLNTLSINATFSSELYDINEVVNEGGYTQLGGLPEGVTTKLLTGTMNEATWEWYIPTSGKDSEQKLDKINPLNSHKKF